MLNGRCVVAQCHSVRLERSTAFWCWNREREQNSGNSKVGENEGKRECSFHPTRPTSKSSVCIGYTVCHNSRAYRDTHTHTNREDPMQRGKSSVRVFVLVS